MAKTKGSKGQQKPKTKQILETISTAQCPLYALEDICKAVQASAVTAETAHDVASAMREKISGIFTQAAERLPKGHEAHGFLKSARERLEDLEALTEFSLGGARLESQDRRALSRAMVSAVSAAGRFMELAEYSLGEQGALCGWIEGMMNVDGMDEKYVQVIEGPRLKTAELLSSLSPQNWAHVVAVAEQLAKSQGPAAA